MADRQINESTNQRINLPAAGMAGRQINESTCLPVYLPQLSMNF
ncbi:MAG TPA: hypothetical protein VMW76_04435 [Bacteroidales bacterium]|nr:hypothetical protein [Bacteroidales bacterium]